MTNDFSKYSHFIQQFRGRVSTNAFENEFSKATEGLAASERFLLKMELKRLAQPCTRLIDLRGHVDGECELYEEDNRSHYLDDVAMNVFEENMAVYGHYCFGVYEAVNATENNFRVMYQKENALQVAEASKEPSDDANKTVEKLQHSAKNYPYDFYINRSEERMNFAISVEILLEDKRKVTCTSSDISANGCKFRLPKNEFLHVGQIIFIRFVGLEQEFAFDKKEGYQYVIKNVHISNGVQSAGAQRIYENEENDGFKSFLYGFIQGNKRRYRISLTNTIKALQARMFEQYLLPKINELPLFFSKLANKYVPNYALTTNNNRYTFEYWMNEKKESTLHYLFTLERMTKLLKVKSASQPITVYSFIHKHQGKFFFYTADESQFGGDKALLKEFLAFAVQKSTFAVFSIHLQKVDVTGAYSPITIADTLNVGDALVNEPLSGDVNNILDNIKLMGVVTDLTTPAFIQEYQQMDTDQVIDIARLKQFGHKRVKLPLAVEAAGITYSNDREEPRFAYKTPVVLTADRVQWKGVSANFSVSGLKVELSKRTILQPGDVVYISFPKLQKITKSFELTELPYEVVRINKSKSILNLKVHVQNHRHIGRAFFKLLIEKNKDKLSSDEYMMMIRGLLPALRNLYSSAIQSSTVFVQTSGSRYKFEALTTGVPDSPLMQCLNKLSDDDAFYNLYPLLKNNISVDVISHQLKQLHEHDAPYSNILFISINRKKKPLNEMVETRLISDFETVEDKHSFIHEAQDNGEFLCVQFKLTRTAEPNIAHLNHELSYISSYAIHKGKQIEQDIYSVAGFIQYSDITQEMLLSL